MGNAERTRSWIQAAALLLAGCGADGPTADVEGRVIVSPEAVHVVATPDVVARVADLQPGGDGRIWVLNSTEPYFVVLGPDGRVEREFGQTGGGPEEFEAPLALVRGADPDEIWTYDLLRHALIRLSTDERRELRLPHDALSPTRLLSFAGGGFRLAPPWLESERDGFLLGRARASSAPPGSGVRLWNADILLVRPDSVGVTLEVRTPIADLLGDPASRYPGATVLLPYPLWTVCADGLVVLYDPLRNQLRRITEEGRELAPVALPEERRLRIDTDRIFGIGYRLLRETVPADQRPDSAEMRRLFEESASNLVSNSADVFPEYADLRCTSDGTLWLQPYDVATGLLGRGPDWYRIPGDGSLTPVTLPEAFRPFWFEAGRIWGTVRDALGVASVAWIGADALR